MTRFLVPRFWAYESTPPNQNGGGSTPWKCSVIRGTSQSIRSTKSNIRSKRFYLSRNCPQREKDKTDMKAGVGGTPTPDWPQANMEKQVEKSSQWVKEARHELKCKEHANTRRVGRNIFARRDQTTNKSQPKRSLGEAKGTHVEIRRKRKYPSILRIRRVCRTGSQQ